MTSDHLKLIRGQIDQGTFNKNFIKEKQKFRNNLDNEVKRLLPDGEMPKLGIFEIISMKQIPRV